MLRCMKRITVKIHEELDELLVTMVVVLTIGVSIYCVGLAIIGIFV